MNVSWNTLRALGLHVGILLLTWAFPAVAAGQIRIDLGGTGDLSRPIEPGTLTLQIENRLIHARYDTVVKRESIPIALLSTDSIPSLKSLLGPRTENNVPTPCDTLRTAVTALSEATAESQVSARKMAVDMLLGQNLCTDVGVVADAKDASAATTKMFSTPVRAGEKITVSITRRVSEGEGPSWTFIFETEPRGEWFTTYGVSFVVEDDQRFFAKGAGDKFTITAEQEARGLRPVPSIFFSWLSSKQRHRNLAWSPTAGFGLSDDSPAFFGGLSVTYNQNISFIAGVAVAAQQRLHGRYTVNEEIGEDLTEEQLHRRVFRPAPMVGVTFRFASNPFKEAKPETPETPVTPETPSTPTPKKDNAGKKGGSGDAEQPAVAGGATEAAVLDPDIRLRFDAKGRLLPESVAQAQELVQRAAKATDVFVVSHGWWNDSATADCFYRRMLGGLRKHQPSYLTADRFKPVFVAIYWPSAVFPLEPSDCDVREVGRRTELSPTGGVTAEKVRAWASAAFPEASTRPEFAAEVARLNALFEQNQNANLAAAASQEIVAILQRWQTLVDVEGVNEGPEQELFAGSAAEVVQRWEARPEARAEAGLSAPKWLNFANAFTFWTMKRRAGVVGSQGLYHIIRQLQPMRERARLRVHMIGHSFGGKLLSASLTGHRADAHNRADSVVILQGAFSQFAFSSVPQIAALGVSTSRPGLYLPVVANKLIAGALVVTHSNADLANRLLYPAGVALVNDVVEASRVARFGSLGAAGIRGPVVQTIDLSTQALRELDLSKTALVNVNASSVILGHSDLAKPNVFGLIWDAYEIASAQ
ncbi:MAG TPA: hypothetical protein VJM31_02955 [Vicinamibacterales bacterium]|nr:hypothetical protein [Vicinamibacterales bacterium]